MPAQTQKLRRFAARGVVVLLCILIQTAAMQDSGAQTTSGGTAVAALDTKTVEIVSHAESDGVQLADLDCASPSAGETLVELRGGMRLGVQGKPHNTMLGRSDWQACFYLQPEGHIEVKGLSRFSGEIVGCGSGTIWSFYRETISSVDPLTGTRKETGTVWFLKGTGTGGLADVSGKYRTESTIYLDFTFDGVGTGWAAC